jgi:[ribosomal protein S5]-alanine N-acetyltransferase
MRTLDAWPYRLEPLVAAHAPQMFAVLSDPAIYEFENAPPVSEELLAQRYQRLESRGPADGSEQWFNWAIRLPDESLAGYVQATVRPDGTALVAYELNSRYWRQGIATRTVQAMLDALHDPYGVTLYVAVLKASNFRSEGLLRKLGFAPASVAQIQQYRDEPDEMVMVHPLADFRHA